MKRAPKAVAVILSLEAYLLDFLNILKKGLSQNLELMSWRLREVVSKKGMTGGLFFLQSLSTNRN